MASSGITFFTEAFKGSLLEVVRIPVPTNGNEEESLQALQNLVATNEFAAFIFEPLCQGAAGMVMYSSEILDKMILMCKHSMDHNNFAYRSILKRLPPSRIL